MASNTSLHTLMMRAAPRLSRRFFTCSQSPRSVASRSTAKTNTEPSLPKDAFKSRRQTPFLQAFRQPQRISSPAHSRSVHDAAAGQIVKTPRFLRARTVLNLGTRNQSTAAGSAAPEGYFPDASNSAVAYWLFGSAVSVFGLVVFGGLTRLTESGYVIDSDLHSRCLHAICFNQWKPTLLERL